ncbi:hypothetical protein [uncultured Sulfitobacter sp.]|uniref:hypothetical protein n=1 Tax=uncultured Sulfitobacter sp. TaxID=191468 RepID=UPI00260C8BA9|nr:hypothetical protein [uncultured Sulfitobacter sp.]
MAKHGLFGSGQGTPPIIAEKSPVFSDPASVFRRGEAGILPERGSRGQLDLVTQLLASGMASSKESGSPLLAALTPMVGGAIGTRTSGLFKEAQAGRDASAMDTLIAAMGGERAAPSANAVSVRREAVPGFSTENSPPGMKGIAKALEKANPAGSTPSGSTNAAADFLISPQTRAAFQPSADALNVSMDFNASESGTARGTEVIIPDNASPEVRAAAERYNQMVAEFAAKNGIENYPVRGVRTRSENGRGVSHTVHAEPFFNSDMAMQEAVAANPEAFAQIYKEAFGNLPGARLIAPHGVGNDRGAASSIFGDETSYGEMMANALLGTDGPASPARQNAARLASGDFSTFAGVGQSQRMNQDSMRKLIGLMSNQDVSPHLRDLASTMLTQGMSQGGPMSPQDQIALASGMLGLEKAMEPPERKIIKDVNGINRYQDTQEQVFTDVQPDPPKQSAAEQKIERLMALDIPRETAVKIADGVLAINRDEYGVVTIIDKATGMPVKGVPTASGGALADGADDNVPADAPVAGVVPRATPAPTNLPPISNAEDGFGLEGQLKGGINAISDFAGLGTPYEGVRNTQDYFNVLSENLTNAFAQTYGRQPTGKRMDAIQALTAQTGGLQGAEGAQSKLRALRSSFATDLETLKAKTARRMRQPDRDKMNQQITGVEAIIAQLDDALGRFGDGETQATTNGIKWRVEQ